MFSHLPTSSNPPSTIHASQIFEHPSVHGILTEDPEVVVLPTVKSNNPLRTPSGRLFLHDNGMWAKYEEAATMDAFLVECEEAIRVKNYVSFTSRSKDALAEEGKDWGPVPVLLTKPDDAFDATKEVRRCQPLFPLEQLFRLHQLKGYLPRLFGFGICTLQQLADLHDFYPYYFMRMFPVDGDAKYIRLLIAHYQRDEFNEDL